MVKTRGADQSGLPVGLTGYRYLLAVALLVALASVPMLAAVAAGSATLGRPAPTPGEATPFITYAPATCPGAPDERTPVRSDRLLVRGDRSRDRTGATLVAGSDWWWRGASRMLSGPPAGPDRDGGARRAHAVR